MFRYILRYYIDPGFAEDKRIAELLELCKKGRIEEVMFFYNPEELFQGYPKYHIERLITIDLCNVWFFR